MPLQLLKDDIVETKKPHPCGGYQFKLTRTGMDFRMLCLTCNKEIWIERPKLEKRIKKIIREGIEVPK
jgi:hypothetical protein